MKLLVFEKEQGTKRIGKLVNETSVLDLTSLAKDSNITFNYSDIGDILKCQEGLKKVSELVEKWEQNKKYLLDLSEVKIGIPIKNPNNILCAALNYRDFCERGNIPIPEKLKIFGKIASTVNGTECEVFTNGHNVTYEGELGVVISKKGKNISAKDAFDYIAGYMVVNDFTANDCVKEDIQLFRGKNFDTFFPEGPYFVTKDEIEDPDNLNIRTLVNGEVRQDSNTENLIFKIGDLIEYFSSFITLEPGDIIASGTPAGTALQFEPPSFVKPGDVVEVTIDNLGTLTSNIK